MNEYLTLLLGLVCAGAGGELFIRGAVGLATWARIPAGIVGATVAAFATSSPELSVSVSSALAGRPDIALGDALGSNVVNVSVILGIGLAISSMQAARSEVSRDYSVALLLPMLLAILAADGLLTRMDGIILLTIFAVWLTLAAREAQRHRQASEVAEMQLPISHASAILSSLGGLVLLVAAGKLIVAGASTIAANFGMEPYVIGATVVAIGTSTPELATTLIARLRGHQDIALGTILGSNIFNGLFIVGVASSIHPIVIAMPGVMTGLLTGLITTFVVFPPTRGVLGRGRGALLLALYVVYVAIMLRLRTAH